MVLAVQLFNKIKKKKKKTKNLKNYVSLYFQHVSYVMTKYIYFCKFVIFVCFRH